MVKVWNINPNSTRHKLAKSKYNETLNSSIGIGIYGYVQIE